MSKLTTLTVLASLVSVAALGCSPSEEDFANAKVLTTFEGEQADIIAKNANDCARLEKELSEYRDKRKEEMKPIHAWWDGLSSGKRERLAEETKGNYYKLAMAMMKAQPCKAQLDRALAVK